ncbi:MAG TPA: signal recognition particle receptor subunit alpha, partial [Acidimicrobiales bacterium]|nr:signal recognition particle receptor subunit alpha [Acidimicrobiales bacterium]
MEIVLLVILLVAVVGSVAAVSVRRRAGRRPELEPPARRPVSPAPPPVLEEAPPAPEVVAPEVVAPEPVKPTFRDRLSKARSQLSGYVGSVLSRSSIDDETWDELEEALIRADVGVAATTALLDDLRARVRSEGIKTPEELVQALKEDLKKRLAQGDRGLRYEPGG